jgi:hypothetical protein
MIIIPLTKKRQLIKLKLANKNDFFSKKFIEYYDGIYEDAKNEVFTRPIIGKYAGKHIVDENQVFVWAIHKAITYKNRK